MSQYRTIMSSKPFDRRALNTLKQINQRNKCLMDLKIRALSVEDKKEFIIRFTTSPLYKYINIFTSDCNHCIENLKPQLDMNDIMKISTYIELMNTLGWKNWKVSLQEEENQLKAKKILLEKETLQKEIDKEKRLQEEILQKKKALQKKKVKQEEILQKKKVE